MDVHDRTSPLLSALLGKLYTLRHRDRELDAATSKSLEDSLKLVEDVSGILRSVSQAWNPQLVEKSGLLGGLHGYLGDFTKRTGIHFPQELVRLPSEVELALFRVVQESLVSVVRHSASPAVTVTLDAKVGDLILEVSDQGRELARGMRNSKGNDVLGEVGFAGLRERLRQLGGELEVYTKGSTSMVTAALPLRPVRK